MSAMKLILASASPRRQELLQKITPDFLVCPSGAEETVPADIPPEAVAAYLSECKASEVAERFPEAAVIGCDTVVISGSAILGKPRDRADAARMLRLLSGNTHTVITGTTIIAGGRTETFSSVTEVTFYPLSDAEIEAYLDTGEPFDKAGAYGIQGKGSLLISGIHGDYFTVVGLPVARLARTLKEMGLSSFS